MRWGIVSDIHSNIEAFDEALAALKDRGAEGWVCCGDIVGYGPSPNEVIERLRALKPLHAVIGNHDLAVMERMDLDWFNPYAQTAVLWTRQELKPEAARWLGALPPRVDSDLFTVAHGSPRDPATEYLLTVEQFLDNISHFKASPCFVGHSHMTGCFRADPAAPLGARARVLSAGDKEVVAAGVPWVLNPGSVGQPRDHDPRASCAVFDDQTREFELLRVPYDVPAVQKRMADAGLPAFLAQRLTFGQ